MQPAHEEAPRNIGNPLTYGVVALVALAVITVSGLLLKSKTAHMEEAQPAFALAPSPEQVAAANAALYPVPIPVEAPAGVSTEPVAVTTEPVTLPVAAAATQSEPQVQQTLAAVEQPAAAPIQKTETPVQVAAAAPSVTTESAPAPAVEKTAEPAVTPAVPAKFPELQLQAIHYRLKNSTVMLNGKTVGLGQNVEGVKVTAIHRYGVELNWRGEKKFLALD